MKYIGLIADHVTPKVTEGGICFTLTGAFSKGAGINYVIGEQDMKYIVRRLTPLECTRLQGFDDGWVDIPETIVNGKKVKPSDAAKYKALGNSVALPQWWWVVNRMKDYLPDGSTMGSLFDGIGGFPCVWEETYGKGTARWASEIEPFPIAVTMQHFPEGENSNEM